MAHENESLIMLSGEVLEADRFVKISASTLLYCDAGEEPVGLTTNPVAITKDVACRCLKGTILKVTGSKAIAASTAIYCTADGKVSDAAVGKQIGITLAAITGDGGKAAAIIWGPRGGNDMLTPNNGIVKFFDDFFAFDGTATVAVWNDAITDGGAIDVIDAINGVISIATYTTDEDESYISTQHQVFKFQTDKNLFFEAKVKLTEAGAAKSNIIIGLSDTVSADILQDASAGPAASYDGVVFFKVDGESVWQFEASNAGAQDTETSIGAFTDATWTTLGFSYDYNDGVTAIITPYVNGVAGTAVSLTIAGLAEMNILLGLKAGSAAAETLLVDYVDVQYER